MKYSVFMPLWNDIDLLKVVLKHYETAHRITIFDCGSNDGGPELAIKEGRSVVYMKENKRLSDEDLISVKNSIWKQDRGIVDYVIVQDTDEIVFFPEYPNDILSALTNWKMQGVTHSSVTSFAVIKSDDEFKNLLQRLKRDQHATVGIESGARADPILVRMGLPEYLYDKPMIFDPQFFEETHFEPGQHSWSPSLRGPGRGALQKPWMLHLRYLGEKREELRSIATRERAQHQFKKGLAIQYNLSDENIKHRASEIYAQRTTLQSPLRLFPGFCRVVPFVGSADFVIQVHEGGRLYKRAITLRTFLGARSSGRIGFFV